MWWIVITLLAVCLGVWYMRRGKKDKTMPFNRETMLGAPLFSLVKPPGSLANNLNVNDWVYAIGPFGLTRLQVVAFPYEGGEGVCRLSNGEFYVSAMLDRKYLSDSVATKIKLAQAAWRVCDFKYVHGTVWHSENPQILGKPLLMPTKVVEWMEKELKLPCFSDDIDPYIFYWFMFEGFHQDYEAYNALQVTLKDDGGFEVQTVPDPPLDFDEEVALMPSIECTHVEVEPWEGEEDPIPGNEPIHWQDK